MASDVDDHGSRSGKRHASPTSYLHKRQKLSGGSHDMMMIPPFSNTTTMGSVTISAVSSPASPIKPCLPFTKSLGDEVVKILVGIDEEYQTFFVHKKLLAKCSAYFDAALNGSFREAFENEIVLAEDSPVIFEFFVTWLYTSQLPSLADYLSVSIARREEPELLLLRLFTLADRIITPDLQALCYERVIETLGTDTWPGTSFIAELYESTAPACQLRKYIIAICAFDLMNEEVHEHTREAWTQRLEEHEAFSVDVSRTIARQRTPKKSSTATKTHPYRLKHNKKFKSHAALVSALQPRVGTKSASPPTDVTNEDDPEGLFNKISEGMAAILFESNAPKVSVPWPHLVLSERLMRGAGWYHFADENSPDAVRCIHCSITMHKWKVTHKPFAQHRIVSPNCPFVKATELGLRPPILPFFTIPGY